MTRNKLKPWLMMLLLFEFLFFMMPGINSTVNLFVVPVSEELGISRSTYSLSFAMSSASMVSLSFFYGKIYKKLGAKKILFLTGVFALLGCAVSSAAPNITIVYIGALLRGLALGLGSTAIVANILFNWFNKYRGLVMGIVFSAVGFGGAVLMPTFTIWVSGNTIGWRRAYMYIGVIVFLASLLAALFIKNNPEDAGTAPFGNPENDISSEIKTGDTVNPSLQTVLKSPAFYASAVIIFFINVSLYSTYAHLEAYLEMKHSSLEIIASALSILALAVGGAKLLYGAVSDRFGMRATAFMAALFHIVSISLLLFGNSDLAAIAGCIFLGFGIGALQLSVSLFAGLFGKENYSFIVGIFSAELGLAWGVGPWATGLYYDIYGNYQGIFTLFLLFGVLIGLFGFLMPKRGEKIKALEKKGIKQIVS